MRHRILSALLLLAVSPLTAEEPDTSRGDRMLADYFRQRTAKLRDACLADITSLDQWQAKRKQLHAELLDMLGLNPLPPKTDLKAVVTGTVEQEEFVVEKVHFQS